MEGEGEGKRGREEENLEDMVFCLFGSMDCAQDPVIPAVLGVMHDDVTGNSWDGVN